MYVECMYVCMACMYVTDVMYVGYVMFGMSVGCVIGYMCVWYVCAYGTFGCMACEVSMLCCVCHCMYDVLCIHYVCMYVEKCVHVCMYAKCMMYVCDDMLEYFVMLRMYVYDVCVYVCM